ncbi:MAG: hypothetical protein H7A46_21455 [Verrucomicrobiales bacterium]|nr:hypothetical protein [Planctomycetota bacterium]MCP5524113.1 hypothetical protein [Verrucomicrobiales bacterium]
MKTRPKHSIVVATVLFLTWAMTGCRPPGFEIGGGGSEHHAPTQIRFAEPTELTLVLPAWGEGKGAMRDRFREVRCHYKTDVDKGFRTVTMRVAREESTSITFSCDLPPIVEANANTVTYYFDMRFDGHYHRRKQEAIPIVREAASPPAQ